MEIGGVLLGGDVILVVFYFVFEFQFEFVIEVEDYEFGFKCVGGICFLVVDYKEKWINLFGS